MLGNTTNKIIKEIKKIDFKNNFKKDVLTFIDIDNIGNMFTRPMPLDSFSVNVIEKKIATLKSIKNLSNESLRLNINRESFITFAKKAFKTVKNIIGDRYREIKTDLTEKDDERYGSDNLYGIMMSGRNMFKAHRELFQDDKLPDSTVEEVKILSKDISVVGDKEALKTTFNFLKEVSSCLNKVVGSNKISSTEIIKVLSNFKGKRIILDQYHIGKIEYDEDSKTIDVSESEYNKPLGDDIKDIYNKLDDMLIRSGSFLKKEIRVLWKTTESTNKFVEKLTKEIDKLINKDADVKPGDKIGSTVIDSKEGIKLFKQLVDLYLDLFKSLIDVLDKVSATVRDMIRKIMSGRNEYQYKEIDEKHANDGKWDYDEVKQGVKDFFMVL